MTFHFPRAIENGVTEVELIEMITHLAFYVVTAGCGLHQRWGGPIEEIRPGDVVTIGPNEKHRHGAAPTIAMTHIAIQESLDGKAVEWMEKVTDEQYNATRKETP